VCDHANDDDVRDVAKAIGDAHGRLDILVNNVFAIPSGPMFDTPFWEQPIEFWDRMHTVGLRSHYVASVVCAPLLLAGDDGGGLIANISSFGGASYQVNVAYGVGKAGVDRLARDMARDLRPHGVCSVSLYPGIVRTERVLAGELPFSTDTSESPEFTGRAIAALWLDAERMKKTGKTLVVAELARAYGFTDVDGTQPNSLRAPSPTSAQPREKTS
jgi:dehydrogenase/reductase SDR family protein 1